MKTFISTKRRDWPLRRVVSALTQYAPWQIEFVETESKADLIVKHIIGRNKRTTKEVRHLQESGQRYAIIQYALRSTIAPRTSAWLPIWRNAVLTWSYYDLWKWCRDEWTPTDFPFYHAPLGVDSSVFYPRAAERNYVIATSGRSAVTESVREAIHATQRAGRSMFHLGPELKRGDDIVCRTGLRDDELATILSQCEYVAGLRRMEGFELLAAEGLLCGARPILFKRHHYRQWHEPWGIFISEGQRPEVIDSLEEIFNADRAPVKQEEREAAARLFNWETIIKGFWDRILDGSAD